MASNQTQVPSAPFAQRELNGETLLDELHDLRGAAVGQKHLNDGALALRALSNLPLAEALVRLKQVASGRFQTQPELAGLLVRWASKLRTQRDLVELCGHFERLAATSALIGAMGRGAARLPARRSKR